VGGRYAYVFREEGPLFLGIYTPYVYYPLSHVV
jgi:hypothetical protein